MVEGNKKDEEISKQDLLNLLKERLNPQTQKTAAAQQPFSNQDQPELVTVQSFEYTVPPPLTPFQEKRVLAQMMMKLHKSIIILCLMLFIIPTITALVALIDPIIAICVPMISIIYPAWLYAQSNKAQEYLSRKYNLQPFTLFRKNNQQNQRGVDFI